MEEEGGEGRGVVMQPVAYRFFLFNDFLLRVCSLLFFFNFFFTDSIFKKKDKKRDYCWEIKRYGEYSWVVGRSNCPSKPFIFLFYLIFQNYLLLTTFFLFFSGKV